MYCPILFYIFSWLTGNITRFWHCLSDQNSMIISNNSENCCQCQEPSDDALTAFNNYQTTGFELYKILIEPIRPYLISEKLIISPDNILSYIPFETIPTGMIVSIKTSVQDNPLYDELFRYFLYIFGYFPG